MSSKSWVWGFTEEDMINKKDIPKDIEPWNDTKELSENGAVYTPRFNKGNQQRVIHVPCNTFSKIKAITLFVS